MKIILYGASGHGKVVADIVAALSEMELVGFVDDQASKQWKMVGRFTVLGDEDILPELLRGGVEGAIVSIGQNHLRLEKAKILEKMGYKLVTAIHPSAVVAPDVKIGVGTVIMAGAVVNAGARIGHHVIVNTGATVDHDCILEDGCHLSPGVHLGGNVSIRREAHVGIGANVIQNVRIGERSVVGAGAVVIRDVLPDKTVVGIPAHHLTKH